MVNLFRDDGCFKMLNFENWTIGTRKFQIFGLCGQISFKFTR